MSGPPTKSILAAAVLFALFVPFAHAGDEEGFLGVSVQNLTPALREAIGAGSETGVLVNDVIDGSPADEAGIETGDLLLTMNGSSLKSADKLVRLVRATEPGDEVKFELIRKGKKKKVEAKIAPRERTKREARAFAMPHGHEERHPAGKARLGVKLHDPDDDLARYFDISEKEGALVLGVEEESPAEEGGIRSGDVITGIGDENIESSAGVVAALAEFEPGDEVGIRLLRKGKKKEVTVILDEQRSFRWIDDTLGPIRNIEIERFHALDDDFEKEMKKLKKEMKKLKKEIERIKEELD